MKTRNRKTENMKTNIKQIAAGTFIALLLIIGNVKTTEASCCASNETNLQMENWMTDYSIWDVKYKNIADYGQETESSLELENWMTNAETWISNFNFEEATEESLELEGWMTDNETWNNDVQIAEATLNVEDWMINNEFWQ
jgi:hypothetical protein